MFYGKSLVATLAVGGLFLGSQQADAAIVAQSTSMVNGGTNINALEYFTFGGPAMETLADANDGNTFVGIQQNGQFSGAGLSWHLPTSAVTAVQPLVDGMTLRLSIWLVSDPANPWVPVGTEGLKFEFYNAELGGFNTAQMTNETENGFGLGLTPISTSLSTTTWSQHSFTVQITDALVDFATLAEIRPVYFEGDFTGAGPQGGKLFADNMVLEVFSDLATANATPLPSNTPGGFNPVDLSGDINGDGFVGIADLNIVLGTWNNGTPPATGTPSIPEPATLSLLGLGGLAVLRRRNA